MEKNDSLGLTDEEYAEVCSAFCPNHYTGELLLSLARQKANFDQAPIERKEGAAHSLFIAATHLLADCLGEDALSELYGYEPDAEASNAEHLRALADRLFRISHIFATHDRTSKSSFETAREELLALAAGDAPRIFVAQEGVKGRPINAYRRARHQLRALAWEAVLRSYNNSTADTHNLVATAYGEEWTTIARWKEPVIRELGQDQYDRVMRDASRGFSVEVGFMRSHEEAEDRLIAHGLQWRAEKRHTLKASR